MRITRRRFLERSAVAAAALVFDARLPPPRLRALRSAVRGRVLAPGDRGYDSARVVDVGRRNRVTLNAEGIATVGPGARNIDVYAALARHGATVPSGSCPMVGAGGLVTGGGMGLAGRELGLALDRVTSFDVVTADGQLRRAGPTREDELFS